MRKKYTKSEYEEALRRACELLNGDFIYGIDGDKLFEKLMEKDGVVCPISYSDFILENLDRFSDDDDERQKAIERLGW